MKKLILIIFSLSLLVNCAGVQPSLNPQFERDFAKIEKYSPVHSEKSFDGLWYLKQYNPLGHVKNSNAFLKIENGVLYSYDMYNYNGVTIWGYIEQYITQAGLVTIRGAQNGHLSELTIIAKTEDHIKGTWPGSSSRWGHVTITVELTKIKP